MARPQILCIDNLPGSGKSTTALDVGGRFPRSRVYLESAADHPLLVGSPDPMGAAFPKIHELDPVYSFATAPLDRLLRAFVGADPGSQLHTLGREEAMLELTVVGDLEVRTRAAFDDVRE